MKRFSCTVPWLNGRPLISCTGATEQEALENLKRLALSDEQRSQIELCEADLAVREPERSTDRVGS